MSLTLEKDIEAAKFICDKIVLLCKYRYFALITTVFNGQLISCTSH